MDPDINIPYATATPLPPPVNLASAPSGTPMVDARATRDASFYRAAADVPTATATAYPSSSYPSSHHHGGPPPPGPLGRPNLQQASTMNGQSSRFNMPHNGQENVPLTGNVVTSLMAQGFTRGLAEALQLNKRAFPLSIWIVDNSGSMAQRDGHRFVETARSSTVKVVECTRWAEMQETVDYHIQMAALLSSPTVFRMLNDPGCVAGPQQFSIAEHGTPTTTEVQIGQQTMLNTTPGGVTPLIPHLQEVRDNIVALEPQLRSEGSKVVFVMATDGLPTDARGISDRSVQQQFVEALRRLEGLPVWVVVRLCTDEVRAAMLVCQMKPFGCSHCAERHSHKLFPPQPLLNYLPHRNKWWSFGTISTINSN
jgi:Mg-chelatase subunit ChlD